MPGRREAAGQLTIPNPTEEPIMHIPAGYYAVPDPTSAELSMTCWHVVTGGTEPVIAAWPPKARYGPVLLRRDMPRGHAAQTATWQAHSVKRQAFAAQILTAISLDPASAAVRFAASNTRCINCCRALKDPRSLLLGIGPDCRRHAGLNDAALLGMEHPALAAAQALHHVQLAGAAA